MAWWMPSAGTPTHRRGAAVHLRIGSVTTATLLFLAGAVGILGSWSLGAAVVLLVATAVATAIAWEDPDGARPKAFSGEDQLVPARIDRR